MAFAFKQQEPIRKGVKRVVCKQMDKALDELARAEEDRDKIIHSVRTRCKKARAVLRLVRSELGEKIYRRDNGLLRDASRPLTQVRDARVMIKTLKKLQKKDGGQIPAETFVRMEQALVQHQHNVHRTVLQRRHAIARSSDRLEQVLSQMKEWDIEHKGWPVISQGLRKTYKKGQTAFDRAQKEPFLPQLHEWRKQAKYLLYQLKLIEPVWPGMIKGLSRQVRHLTELLGDYHDLSMLRQMVVRHQTIFSSETAPTELLGLINWQCRELKQHAFKLGQRIYADRPRDFIHHLEGYWKIWRNESAGTKAA